MSPKTKEQFELIRQKSITAIKDAALELFGHNGYHSTSISQIAKEAGVSKGLLYNYFTSKEELLHVIVMEAVEFGDKMLALLQSEEDPFLQLTRVIEATFQIIKSDLHHWKLFTSLAFQTDVLTSLEPILKQKQETGLNQLSSLFERMDFEDPKREAYFFASALDGILLHFMHMENDYPIDEMKEFILNRYTKK